MKLNSIQEKLQRIDRFQKMPQMTPWVGDDYGVHTKRVLFIGESHYLPYESTIQKSINEWYGSSIKNLNADEIAMTSTAKIVSERFNKNSIWRNPAKIIISSFSDLPTGENGNVYTNFAFYNFFQRPAETQGKSIIVQSEDLQVANDTLKKIVDILKPEVIVFLSTKAFNACSRSDFDNSVYIDYSPHPGKQWWNRIAKKYDNKRGSEKFKWIIDTHIK